MVFSDDDLASSSASSSTSSINSSASSASGPPSLMSPGPKRRPKQQTPQQAVDEFWTKFTSKAPGKATTTIPQNPWTQQVKRNATNSSTDTSLKDSYETAAAMCSAKVKKIVQECRRINKKYRDIHFDVETDLKRQIRDTLESLSNQENGLKPGSEFKPGSAKRVPDIYDKPRFYIDGPTANDVRQGRDGDCWLMAALCTLSNKKGLIEKLCVAHDQAVGVYGFVFHRDGEWISEIVDDFLFLTKTDYDEGYLERVLLDDLERLDPEEAYRRIYQTNSNALYFAQCKHPQETWLPLLEKAYAKAHGDYAAIEGGFGGEGIEDLTGGVTSELYTTDILDKEHFWKEEMLKVNQDFLFGCSTGVWGTGWGDRKGIVELHAYSIQRAVEIDGKRLVRLKNPWGKGEWKGAWSDGSKEWTPQWLEKLGHRFGDDGDFWISYEDMLRKYQAFERTRLFGNDWHVNQIWTTFDVPWTLDYHDTRFCFSLSQPGPVVIVLAQLDDRYFRGLQGQYKFTLGFRLHKAGHEDYLVRSETPYRMRRSVNVELELEEGDYEVRVRMDTTRDETILPVDQVMRRNVKGRRDKMIRVGLAYDLAHSKGAVAETAEEKAAKAAKEAREKDKELKKLKEKILKEKEEDFYLRRKRFEREQAKVLARREKDKVAKAEKLARRTAKKDARREARNVAHEVKASEDTEKAAAHESENQKAVTTNGEGEPFDDQLNLSADGPPGLLPLTHSPVSDTCESEVESDDDARSMDAETVYSDRELNIIVEDRLIRQASPVGVPIKPQPAEEPDEFELSPWNAVAVVGLRIYHKSIEKDDDGTQPSTGSPGSVVKLRVVRSNPYLDGDAKGEKEKADEKKTAGLDVDDSAKDATLEGGAQERQESIMGDQKTGDA